MPGSVLSALPIPSAERTFLGLGGDGVGFKSKLLSKDVTFSLDLGALGGEGLYLRLGAHSRSPTPAASSLVPVF